MPGNKGFPKLIEKARANQIFFIKGQTGGQ
jgi:hypothetical protein